MKLKTYTADELKEILKNHKEWLEDNTKGERANLTWTNLTWTDLTGANLKRANLTWTDLTGANLTWTDLTGTNHQFINSIDFMSAFDKTDEGYIVYKSFGENFEPPKSWKINEGSIIEELPDASVAVLCGAGINFGTKAWVKENCNKPIWKCLIKWEWLPGVIVPYQTDGKARCYKLQLLEIVKKASL
jgi:hypothetical protein